ncbi:wd g-beta repeat-containing protein [Cyclospora cayetanensis]|uniref:Wd g-beta repeat-containing protein n=1 Tax=Cyclospora cayetanensis TaxID=88456 RepID=A0A1D3CS10_9EIME|nr:wd g-beta repeat-containing protein [Cyclospora cayetanensis]
MLQHLSQKRTNAEKQQLMKRQLQRWLPLDFRRALGGGGGEPLHGEVAAESIAKREILVSLPESSREGSTSRRSNGRWKEINPWLSSSLSFDRQPAEPEKATESEATFSSHAATERLPVYGRFTLDCHSPGTTTALSVALKGNRMATGGSDGCLRLWDFGNSAVLSSFRYYRSVMVSEKHRIASVSFGNSSGSKGVVGVSSGDSCCYIFSAEGELLQQTTKGDQYVRDLNNTKGHTHAVRDVQFHPTEPNLFLTASLDATCRIWDLNGPLYGIDQSLTPLFCLKAIDRRGANSNVCTCCCCLYTPTSADAIVVGCSDGSVQLWGNAHKRKTFTRPDQVLRGLHAPQQQQQQQRKRFMGIEEAPGETDCGVAAMAFAPNDKALYTRGLDGSLCLLDLRKFSSPVFRIAGLPTGTLQQGVCLSPFRGEIRAFDAATGAPAFTIPFEESAPTALCWNAETNQLYTCCTDGNIAVSFDPLAPLAATTGAARLVMATPPAASSRRQQERRDHEMQQLLHQQLQENIFAGDALPEGYVETADGRLVRKRIKPKMREEMFEETQKTKLPPIPSKRGLNGQPGAIGNRSLHMLQQLNLVPSQQQQQELIPGATAAERFLEGVDMHKKQTWSGTFISRAYAKTAPKPIVSFDEAHEVDKADQMLSSSKRCAMCGLRCCQCEGRSNKVLRLRE